MTTLDTLRSARELISDEKRWCQGVCARSADGFAVEIDSCAAVRWCVLGALGKVKPDRAYSRAIHRLESLAGPISSFNDTHTHAEVMSLFDRAIEDEEKKHA